MNIPLGLAFALCVMPPSASGAAPLPQQEARIHSAVVKIFNISQRPDYYNPWKDSNFSKGSGSGVIIEGNRILTSAHLVSDSKFLQVEKETRGELYPAEVSFIAHDCDLALLRVLDESFFEGTSSLPFCTEMPEVGSQVSLHGFPAGGSKVSVTQGIISRIEYMGYTHSGIDSHLGIQIDAAINVGNSGGPALYRGAILGIAFQSASFAENMGYLVPYKVVAHFLEDIRDGVYDGYPKLWVRCSNLINPAYREYLQMSPGQSGVVVTQVIDDFSADGVVRPGDVLLEVGGSRIENDGTIYADGDSYRLEEMVEQLQVGDQVAFRLLREGKPETVEIVLKRKRSKLKLGEEYESRPEYFVYGGLVFEPLSREYLKTWGDQWWNKAKKQLLYKYLYYYVDELYRDYPEPIILVRILPAEVNSYYKGVTNQIVERINGRPTNSIREVIEAFDNPQGEFHVIEFEGDSAPCVMSAAEMKRANAEILATYEISQDRHLAPQTR